MEANAGALHLVAQAVAHVLVEAAQDVGAAQADMDLGAEALEQSRELHRDIAAADHQQAARKSGQVEDLVRGDGVFQPLDIADEAPARRRSRSGCGAR